MLSLKDLAGLRSCKSFGISRCSGQGRGRNHLISRKSAQNRAPNYIISLLFCFERTNASRDRIGHLGIGVKRNQMASRLGDLAEFRSCTWEEKQVPHRAFGPIRNDILMLSARFGMTSFRAEAARFQTLCEAATLMFVDGGVGIVVAPVEPIIFEGGDAG
jgi:hypothetical protein